MMNWYYKLKQKLAKTGKQHVFRVGAKEHRVSTGTVAAWLAVCVVLSTAGVGVVSTFSTSLTQVLETGYAAGSGTEAEPYIIDTPQQLVHLAQRTAGGARTRGVFFQIGTPLDMAGVSMPPIGSAEHPFEGSFNGSGLQIDNLNIFAPDMDHAGLFGVIGPEGAVRSLLLGETGAVLGGRAAGAVAGLNQGLVENCENHLAVQGTAQVGGLVGRNEGTLTNGGNFGPVTAAPAGQEAGLAAGGVAGANTGSIQSCMNLGAVTAPSVAGGLVGSLEQGLLQNSYAAAAVSAGAPAGGCVGLVAGGSVENCYFCLDLCPLAGENDPSVPLAIGQMQQHSFVELLNGTDHGAPAPTEAPQPGASAEPSAAPEPSAEPEPSSTPDPSAAPGPSASPDPAVTPDPGETPAPGTEPSPSAAPESTAEPVPSAGPEAGVPPQASQAPAASPTPAVPEADAQPEPQLPQNQADPAGAEPGLPQLRTGQAQGAGSMLWLAASASQPFVPAASAPAAAPESEPAQEPEPTEAPQPGSPAEAEPPAEGPSPESLPEAAASEPVVSEPPAEDLSPAGPDPTEGGPAAPCEQDEPFYLPAEGAYPLLKYDWLGGVAVHRGVPSRIESWLDAASQPGGGDGSAAAPYRVSAPGELAWLAGQCLAGNSLEGVHFALAAELDLSGGLWAPIGTAETPFAGILLGEDHTVSGMDAAFPEVDDVGLFGVLAPTARVESLTVRGTARGAARVGGVAGSSAGSILRCQSFVAVNGVSQCGGIAGQNTGTLEYSAAYGLVSAQELAGGLAGQNGGLIRFAFCRGGAAGSLAGGLVGEQTAQGRLSNCYTAAPVSGQGSAAALAANAGSLSRVYYCTDEGYTGPENGLGEGRALAAMQTDDFLQELNAVD